jgi:formate dehydrogenase major subunit
MRNNKVIKINDKEYPCPDEQITILNYCKKIGINIPSFCYDERLTPYGSCWMCIVQIKGRKGVVPACSTLVTPDMDITTNNEIINSLRKANLELLFSNHYGDCYPPCKLTCPSNIDIQGYIALINCKEYSEALKLIKEDCPMPATIGRICPRPCETECRRNIVDEAVGIDYLKKFVADMDLKSSEPYIPKKEADKNIKIAVIGAGPAGLSCAYYLSKKGYKIDIFDMMPKSGGMLRYGIPDYRLSKKVLDKEIEIILKTGNIKIYNNKTFGKDITTDSLLQEGYKSIFFATGAWLSNKMNIEGEEFSGIYQGIDFLIDFALGKIKSIGKKVAIVGGGNTAIDAARTSVRLGAEKVYIIYRRTKNEMPAAPIEVEEAEDEGIEFILLTNPNKYIGNKNNQVTGIECLRMELGEPDKSGRRRPVPIKGSEYCIEIDTVIEAIGQKVDTTFIDKNIKLTKWNTLNINAETSMTNIDGIFAGGDAESGPDIAIKAMNAGKVAAKSIDNYLNNDLKPIPKLFSITKDTYKEIDKTEYSKYPKLQRNNIDKIDPAIRRKNFDEVEKPYSEEQAKKESMRCLSCGCSDVFECKLKEYGEIYKPDFKNYAGELKKHPIDILHPYIIRDNNKCIYCGKCVRICLEYQGPAAFGYIFRGFESEINPKFQESLKNSECTSCGQCVVICPTGALTEKISFGKPGPYKTKTYETVCVHCSLNCPIEIETIGTKIVNIRGKKINEHNYEILCRRGKFSFFKENKLENNFEENIKLIRNKIPTDEYEKTVIEISPSLPTNYISEIIEIFNNKFKFNNFTISSIDKYIEFKNNIKTLPLTKEELLKENRIIFIGKNYTEPDYETIFKITENLPSKKIVSVYKEKNPFDVEKIETSISIENFCFKKIKNILDKYNDYILLFDYIDICFLKELSDYINKNNIKYFLLSKYSNIEGALQIYKEKIHLFEKKDDYKNRINIGFDIKQIDNKIEKEINITTGINYKTNDYIINLNSKTVCL